MRHIHVRIERVVLERHRQSTVLGIEVADRIAVYENLAFGH